MNCKFCERKCKNANSLRNHERLCHNNPNRQIFDRAGEKNPMYGKTHKGSNQHTKAKKEGRTVIISDSTRKKLSESAKGKKHTEEIKKKISETMQRIVREKPESYSASNVNGRSKKIWYKDAWMDSSWEYEFAKWCDSNQVQWEKNKKSFEYEWDGLRLYYPDFFLPKLNMYVEIKGYERERDLAKWKVVPNLLIVKAYEIKKIKNGTFKI